MESTVRFHSSHVKALFSDQSHLLFYGCSSSSSQCKPFKAHPHTGLTSSSWPPPPLALRCASKSSSSSTTIASSTCSELDLLKELAILKAQVKQKKKQLKAIAKEKKAALKQRKGKAKGESSSSSSSSSSTSESCDEERMPLNMRLMQKDSLQNREEEGLKQDVAVRGGLDHTDIQQERNEGATQCVHSRSESHGSTSVVERERPSDPDETRAGCSHSASRAGRAGATSGTIEVCVGGKCKRAGSQQLVSSFKAQIPASAGVEATPCKCMGRCSAAMNVKVHKEDTNPQHHSHVSVDDVGLILSHHFGLGPPMSGLPCFPSLSRPTPSKFMAEV